MQIYNTIVGFFQGGGVHMIPIALTFALGIAIAVERFLFLGNTQTRNSDVWNKIMPLLLAGQYDQARAVAGASDTAVGRLMSLGLGRLQTTRRRDELELAMEEALMADLPRIERLTHYLHMLANIAMLFGLLGTVWGLITGFTAIANVDPAEKANMLSASFSVAMNATAFGLITAIPLLLLHALLQTRTSEIVESLEMASVKFLNLVAHQNTAAPAG